jgi:hypothetical protein
MDARGFLNFFRKGSTPMKFAKRFSTVLIFSLLVSGCGTQSDSTRRPGALAATVAGENTTAIQIADPATTGTIGYINEPLVSVTVCSPGTSQCQTISNVLVDTGSYGLRVFSSVLNVPLPQKTDASGNTIAECAQFGTGNDWGPIATADVVLGSESAVTVPVQILNSSFPIPSAVPKECPNPDVDPNTTGFNGILGVGLFASDCGPGCATLASNKIYYTCSSSSCTSTVISEPEQVQNPVAALSQDNNGVAIVLPSVPPGGANQVSGTLVFGIGTQTNNTPSSGVQTFQTDPNGFFQTSFNGQNYEQSFIDTGSNGLYFPKTPALPSCAGEFSGFYCPTSTQNLTATMKGAPGSASLSVPFVINNAQALFTSTANAFVDLGGANPTEFDWGLPFFFGRTVYIGLQNAPSPLGTGPYWAF